MTSEFEKYQKLVNEHRLKSHIKNVEFVRKGRVTVALMTLRTWGKMTPINRLRNEYEIRVCGISVCNPEDTFDRRTGQVVAMYHALQQSLNMFKTTA